MTLLREHARDARVQGGDAVEVSSCASACRSIDSAADKLHLFSLLFRSYQSA